MWRIAHGDLIGEVQEVIHCGRDLPIVREVMRPGWRVAESLGWKPTTANGKEQIENLADGSRWLARTIMAAYGYSPGYACVDEAWDIKAADVAEALEPALMDRCWPQLLLTSTSHRRATSLMRNRILGALTGDDTTTLLLWWGALPDADFSDPAVWKAASPYWNDERDELLTSKYLAATAAQPNLDDPDPVRSFAHQYLNAWDLHETAKVEHGNRIATEEEWAALTRPIPGHAPHAAAIESWFEEGCALALAWRDGTVHVTTHPSVEAAHKAAPTAVPLIVGASLVNEPTFKGQRLQKGTGRGAQAAMDLSRALTEGWFRHTDQAEFNQQVLDIRTQPTPDGIRVISKTRTDALKAAMWAYNKARGPRIGSIRILTSSD
jgi:hypothetical protein